MTAASGAAGAAAVVPGVLPRVDVVVATHRPDRPVERAVRSVVDGSPDAVRALVVAHGLDTSVVDERLASLPDHLRARVRVIRHDDGIASAAGPMNAGLDASAADLVGLLGSDDWVEPGAVEAWARLAEEHTADAVIARVQAQSGRLVRTPPTRLGRRTEGLDLAKDRLAYRTAPLGLMRRSTLARDGIRLSSGLAVGEDLEPGLRLWATGRVVYAAGAPSYVMGEDAVVRTTTAPRPVRDDLACCTRLVGLDWFAGLPADHRLAIVVKLIRIHVFGLVHKRRELSRWEPADRADLARIVGELLDAAPAARLHLSRAEEAVIEACLDPTITARALAERSARRIRHGRPDTVLTASPQHVLAAQSPLRLMAASLLMR